MTSTATDMLLRIANGDGIEDERVVIREFVLVKLKFRIQKGTSGSADSARLTSKTI